MKHIFPIALFVALLVVGGTYALQQKPTTPAGTNVPQAIGEDAGEQIDVDADADTTAPAPVVTKPAPVAPKPTPAPAPAPVASGYTSAQVAQHASSQSCWSSVNGNVYDLTNWISQHPGGAGAIASMCGHDASAAFNGQHGGQRRPASELAGFLLGPLH